MAKFEKISRFENAEIALPIRKTANSAGYDFEVAEDIIIPSYLSLSDFMTQVIIQRAQITATEVNEDGTPKVQINPYTLEEMGSLTKEFKTKPTLVSTGMKCKLAADEYLELSVRSSCPLKYWLILANGVGIIDSDYYNNPDNEGEIFFQMINLSPIPIHLKKGDIIGQGIIKKYITTEDDQATGDRVGGLGSTSA